MNQASILIVENEPIIALGLQEMVEDLDFQAIGPVGSGREVIEAVARKLPDLVLMDISLDGELDGIEVAEIIRASQNIPVIFVTALKDTKLVTRAKESGAFGYLTKPFDQGGLSNAIELALFRHGMEKQLRESEERFRIFAEYACDWEYWLGADGKAIYHSPSCLRITGYAAEDFMAQPGLLGEIVHPADTERVKQYFFQGFSGVTTDISIDFRIITRAGEVRWLNHVCQPVHADNGQFRGQRAGNRDITLRKELELKLEHMAIHDSLTDLPNRGLLLDRLSQAIATASRKNAKMAVLFIDLDNFKMINDHYGHRVGDLTLQEVAKRVSASIRHSDTLARFGGDEFVVVLSELAAAEDAGLFAQKIFKGFESTFVVDGKHILIQASIGIALFPEHGEDPDALIAQADAAMYRVKLAGRQGIKMASP